MDERMPYVHSCPRSGTHLLAATLKRNFYADKDVGLPMVGTGHWNSRRTIGASPYAQMFRPGAHVLYNRRDFQDDRIHFYIYRDGRDEAVSYWNAKVLINPERRDWPFSRFLRMKLDSYLSPSNRIKIPKWTVTEQWLAHLGSWEGRDDVFYVRYERLVLYPQNVIEEIADHIGWEGDADDFKPVRDIVGVAPGKGKVGAWTNVFSKDDLDYFHSVVPKDFWGLWEVR
jgi:hypothetical protein